MNRVITGLESFKTWLGKLLCKIGIHSWTKNHCGIRLCKRCPKIDRYYGVTGFLRYMSDTTDQCFQDYENDEQLRSRWESWDKEVD